MEFVYVLLGAGMAVCLYISWREYVKWSDRRMREATNKVAGKVLDNELESKRLGNLIAGLEYRVADHDKYQELLNTELLEWTGRTKELVDEYDELVKDLASTIEIVEGMAEGLSRTDGNYLQHSADQHMKNREFQKQIDELRNNSEYAPLYYGVVLRDGCAVHHDPKKGSPIKHVLNKDTRVMVMEIKEHNGVNWARIEDNGWIHGGWEYIHPPKIKGTEKGPVDAS